MRLLVQSKDAIRKREHYRRDPAWRANYIKLTRERLEAKCQNFPIYEEITAIRKRLWGVREELNKLLEKVAAKERKLFRLAQKKDALVAEWKRQKQPKGRKDAA